MGLLKKEHAATGLNDHSSRSHTIFKLILRTPGDEENNEATLSIVDLAGSERGVRTATTGKELQQACKINQSLSVLGKCIEAMKSNTIYVKKKLVPFRESKLTMLFQEYFQGEENIMMITTINPSNVDLDETLRVLAFSCRAKEIKPIRSKVLSTNQLFNTILK